MKLERKTRRDGNLYPDVYNYLRSLPDDVLFHADYTERHPFSIYNLSIQRVILAFKAVLDELDQVSTALLDSSEHLNYRLENLPKLQQELLHSLQSHIDDCYRILKTIHPPVSIDEIFVERWLEKAKHPTYKDFQNAVKDYRKSFAMIVNKIKHNGGQLRPLMMYARGQGIVVHHLGSGIKFSLKDARIVGYFLEGMQPSGRVGPDCDVHPDGKTAISLNRDLRYHFANLYRIGNHLRRAIVRAVRRIHGVDLPQPIVTELSPRQEEIEQVAERISSLPPLFFQSEFFKATPDVTFLRNTQGAELTLEFSRTRRVTWSGDVMIYGEIQVDSVCLEYQLPYM